MIRQCVLVVALLGLTACSTSGSELPATGERADASGANSKQTVAQGDSEQVAASGVRVEDEDELICTKERLTGSRIPTKVCLTRSEREMLQKQSQAYIEKDRRKPGGSPTE
jgi:hypothetical protein